MTKLCPAYDLILSFDPPKIQLMTNPPVPKSKVICWTKYGAGFFQFPWDFIILCLASLLVVKTWAIFGHTTRNESYPKSKFCPLIDHKQDIY